MSDELRNLKRRVERARRLPTTCPASRQLHRMALDASPHAAAPMLYVLESLWKARTELARLKGATGADTP